MVNYSLSDYVFYVWQFVVANLFRWTNSSSITTNYLYARTKFRCLYQLVLNIRNLAYSMDAWIKQKEEIQYQFTTRNNELQM